MKLIVISHSGEIPDEAAIVSRMFEAGLETFHLRKHKLSTRKTKAFLKQIPSQYHSRIVIHSHHKLAACFHLKGIHLTKSHRKQKWKTWLMLKYLRLRNPALLLSTSFSNIGDLLQEHDHAYDYVFLSPVFDSLSSQFQGGFTAHSLRSALQKTRTNVVARGGIDINAIPKSATIGFHGLAFYSHIWKSRDPVKSFNEVVEAFETLQIRIE